MRSCKEKACELGAGSGVISLLCASSGKMRDIDAFELQDDIFAVAAKNVEETVFPARCASCIPIYAISLRNITAGTASFFKSAVSESGLGQGKRERGGQNFAQRTSRQYIRFLRLRIAPASLRRAFLRCLPTGQARRSHLRHARKFA